MAFFLVDQLRTFHAVDFQNDLLAFGSDTIFVPLAGRFHGRHLAKTCGRSFAVLVDHRLFAIGRKQFRAFTRVNFVADTSEIATALKNVRLIAHRQPVRPEYAAKLNAGIAAIAFDPEFQFQLEIGHIATLPRHELIRFARVFRCGLTCNRTIAHRPIAHIQSLPALQ